MIAVDHAFGFALYLGIAGLAALFAVFIVAIIFGDELRGDRTNDETTTGVARPRAVSTSPSSPVGALAPPSSGETGS